MASHLLRQFGRTCWQLQVVVSSLAAHHAHMLGAGAVGAHHEHVVSDSTATGAVTTSRPQRSKGMVHIACRRCPIHSATLPPGTQQRHIFDDNSDKNRRPQNQAVAIAVRVIEALSLGRDQILHTGCVRSGKP